MKTDFRSRYAAVTIASRKYLSLARVTARSFKEHNPDTDFFVLLADDPSSFSFDPEDSIFTAIPLGDLGLANAESVCFRYKELELSYALTPCAIRYLLGLGYQGVMFLKQETLVLGELLSVAALLDSSSVFLTPHLLEPIRRPEGTEWEIHVALAGIFNGGFLGFANTPEAGAFLDWWAERTLKECFLEVAQGLHYEQRWLDFVPSFVRSCTILRDPGLNVGHWNLLDRDVQFTNGRVTACGIPCRVFRFSGYNPDLPGNLTRYNADLVSESIGDAADVLRKYREMLIEAKFDETRRLPYAFDSFDNGVPIMDGVRRIYAALGEQAAQFGNPFEARHPSSFFDRLRSLGLQP